MEWIKEKDNVLSATDDLGKDLLANEALQRKHAVSWKVYEWLETKSCGQVLVSGGERGGLLVERQTPEREVGGFETFLHRVVSLSKTLYCQKVLVISRKWWLRPEMTEKLLTGKLSLNTKKTKKQNWCLVVYEADPLDVCNIWWDY